MKKIITILIMTLLLCGCGKSNNEKMKEYIESFNNELGKKYFYSKFDIFIKLNKRRVVA